MDHHQHGGGPETHQIALLHSGLQNTHMQDKTNNSSPQHKRKRERDNTHIQHMFIVHNEERLGKIRAIATLISMGGKGKDGGKSHVSYAYVCLSPVSI